MDHTQSHTQICPADPAYSRFGHIDFGTLVFKDPLPAAVLPFLTIVIVIRRRSRRRMSPSEPSEPSKPF